MGTSLPNTSVSSSCSVLRSSGTNERTEERMSRQGMSEPLAADFCHSRWSFRPTPGLRMCPEQFPGMLGLCLYVPTTVCQPSLPHCHRCPHPQPPTPLSFPGSERPAGVSLLVLMTSAITGVHPDQPTARVPGPSFSKFYLLSLHQSVLLRASCPLQPSERQPGPNPRCPRGP